MVGGGRSHPPERRFSLNVWEWCSVNGQWPHAMPPIRVFADIPASHLAVSLSRKFLQWHHPRQRHAVETGRPRRCQKNAGGRRGRNLIWLRLKIQIPDRSKAPVKNDMEQAAPPGSAGADAGRPASKPQYMTVSKMKLERGWTPGLIDRLLGSLTFFARASIIWAGRR